MNQKELLFQFEEKYPFLYEIEVNGVPIYAGIRDGVANCFREKSATNNNMHQKERGRIYLKRIIDSMYKFIRFRKAETLVFTSSMYRRDQGRNLAVEYLIEKYPNVVVFEWPSKNDAYDRAYFDDAERYCPIDFYIVLYKIYIKICQKKLEGLEEECTELLCSKFSEIEDRNNSQENEAIRYILDKMPNSYATTVLSHELFRKLFKKYKNVEYAIDFWGSARENIIPVLPGNPKSIELQHGIITSVHPGYIYPKCVSDKARGFFGRTLLVYGEKTKKLLIEESIFKNAQIDVIGNPRIEMYQKMYGIGKAEKKWILFTSQPYEQDGSGENYYQTVIRFLKTIQAYIQQDNQWSQYQLAVKLHPRENNGVKALYEDALPGSKVFDNSSELYRLLCESILQITVSSTSLYEAAILGTPTVCVRYIHSNLEDIFGFEPRVIEEPQDVEVVIRDLMNHENYSKYNSYLKEMTKQYM